MHTIRADQKLAGLLVIAVTVLVFLPSLGASFINWDDSFLLSNYGWRGLGLKEISWWFASFTGGNYKPLTWASFALDFTFWRLNPAGYHLTNILIHSLNALLVYYLVLRLGYRVTIRSALIAALFFSLHPLRVESVSWISERKDVLFFFFYLISLLAYRRDQIRTERGVTRRPGSGRRLFYLLSLIAAYAALLSKPMAATIPAIIVLFDLFPVNRYRRRGWKLAVEKVPYFLGTFLLTGATLYGQSAAKALSPIANIGFYNRLLLSDRSWLFYLIKTVWPTDLQIIYGTTPVFPIPFIRGPVPIILLLVLTSLTVYWAGKGRRSWPLFGWLFFLITWLPISGLIPAGQTWVADRFTYLPAVGISMIIAVGLGGLPKKFNLPITAIGAAVLILLTMATMAQEKVWNNAFSLWTYAVRLNPRSATAYNNLGNLYIRRGDWRKAEEYYKKSIELRPDYPQPHYNLAMYYYLHRNYDPAVEHFYKTFILRSDFKRALTGWGYTRWKRHRAPIRKK